LEKGRTFLAEIAPEPEKNRRGGRSEKKRSEKGKQ